MVKLVATIDDDIKAPATALFESWGMSLSTAVNVFLHQAVREQRMPFSIGGEAIPAARDADALNRRWDEYTSLIPADSRLATMDAGDMRKEYERRED